MSILRCSLLEARNLSRALGIWPYVVLVFWPLLVKLQEPDFFLREAVPFYWASLQSLLLLGFGLLPLCLRFCQAQETAHEQAQENEWFDRLSRDPLSLVLIPSLAVLWYGLRLALAAGVIFYTVSRIYSNSEGSLSRTFGLLTSGLPFLGLAASLSPVLLRVRARTPRLVFGWLVLLAIAVHFFGPVLATAERSADFSGSNLNSARLWGILSILCATLGGLAFSFVHCQHRLRT